MVGTMIVENKETFLKTKEIPPSFQDETGFSCVLFALEKETMHLSLVVLQKQDPRTTSLF